MLNIGTFIKFEEIGFSNNNYKKGKKFAKFFGHGQASWCRPDGSQRFPGRFPERS